MGPAPVSPAHRRLAERLPPSLRLGTSSWSFPGWAGSVYDRERSKAQLARRGLAAYSRHPLLRAVGIDRTFYAPIAASAFAEYAAMVPPGFRFLVKAHSACTSPWESVAGRRPTARNERFLDAGYAIDEVVTPFREGLAGRGGVLVFQFPPLGAESTRDPASFAARLGEFLLELPRGPSYAVELRDRELLGPDYRQALEAAGARHCLNVHPRMPTLAEQLHACGSADGLLVVRWMLHAGLGYEDAVQRYEPFSAIVDEDRPTRCALAGFCVDRIVRGQPVIVVANNKAEGSAPWTVFRLAEEIGERLG